MSVFDETWSELILATRRIFLYVTGEKSACGIRPGLKKRSFYIKNCFYIEKRIYWGKKSACGNRPGLKKRSFDIKNCFYIEKRIY